MIKEYISELMLENDERLKGLENQMKQLLDELDCEKEWLETLQEQKNLDKNIFSPRAIDTGLKEKTEEARNNIRKTEQDIEHVRVFIEEELKKKEEYEKLLDELENYTESKSSEETSNDCEVEEDEKEKDPEYEDLKNAIFKLTEKFLPEFYKKTELCLAILYSDKSGCKNELKNMKTMIKKASDELKRYI